MISKMNIIIQICNVLYSRNKITFDTNYEQIYNRVPVKKVWWPYESSPEQYHRPRIPRKRT